MPKVTKDDGGTAKYLTLIGTMRYKSCATNGRANILTLVGTMCCKSCATKNGRASILTLNGIAPYAPCCNGNKFAILNEKYKNMRNQYFILLK